METLANGLTEEEEEEVTDIPKINIGLCAMNKKTKSRPMKEILSRIVSLGFFNITIFSDDVIKNEPIENWPLCDCLISFFSSGFPLEKAIAYANLRKPLLLNDLEMQFNLHDRCEVYSLLKKAGIETPRNAILRRDENGTVIGPDLIETEDSVQIGDTVFHKPFVEKPLDAEDHSVFIYYPTSAGGGSQRLFRKIGSRSSVYSRQSCVRRTGSYIYEDFVPTDGTDVKVYTVGPEYAHAEARKSPSLDGKVERDSQGKEIRYPVILSQYEKEIANKVCTVFKQSVCGFDLLRTHGKSYVCDVNGFSFVKTSKKYYDDCAMVLSSMILFELAPQLYMPYNPDYGIEDLPPEEREVEEGTMLELRCVVGIIRHGDRTPKQKLKMEVRHPKFIELFNKYEGFKERYLKLKQPNHLQEVLDIARELLQEIKDGEQLFENPSKLHQIKSVLEMYGYFSGINRKIQFKYLGRVRDTESSGAESQEEKQGADHKNRKESGEQSLLLILKWGGELTSMGRAQAEELGEAFRWMYPESQDEYAGGGLLRLHSTYRHDLKIYASDEGRVQMTAAAFAKGFLALEGELTPILVHLVRSDKNVTEMLDTSVDAARIMGKVKHHLHEILLKDEDFIEEDVVKLAPTKSDSVLDAMKKVKNPHQMCGKLHLLVQGLTTQLKDMINDKVMDSKKPYLYHGESLELMTHRWTKLEKDFKLRNGDFDISLIPDLYDCIKYDVQHNSNLGLNNTVELYNCAKALADIVIPQEYGITKEEKLDISQRVCFRLLRKIRADLKHADISETTTRLNPKYSRDVVRPHRHVRTRLYFTSESHIHTVTNALRFGKLFAEIPDAQWQRAIEYLGEVSELNYMTQIVFMLYEDPKAEPQSDQQFYLRLHFSNGARTIDDPRYVGSPVRVHGEGNLNFDPWILSPWGEFVKGQKEDGVTGAEDVATPSDTMSDQGSLAGNISGDSDAMQNDTEPSSVDPCGSSIVSKVSSTTSMRSDESLHQRMSSQSSYSRTCSYSSVEQFYDPADKPFDENLFGDNELPRCSIGGNLEEYVNNETDMTTHLVQSEPQELPENQPLIHPHVPSSLVIGESNDHSAQHATTFGQPEGNCEPDASSDVFAKNCLLSGDSEPRETQAERDKSERSELAQVVSRTRFRSKSEGDVGTDRQHVKRNEHGKTNKFLQPLQEASGSSFKSMEGSKDSANVTSLSTENTKISSLSESQCNDNPEDFSNSESVIVEEVKDYYELLDSIERPRRGSEDGSKYEEGLMALLKPRRNVSCPGAFYSERSEERSEEAKDKEKIVKSSKPPKESLAVDEREASLDKAVVSQQVQGLQLPQPPEVSRTRLSVGSPPSTAAKDKQSVEQSSELPKENHDVYERKTSSISTNLSQQWRRIQLPPPCGVLKSRRRSVEGLPSTNTAAVKDKERPPKSPKQNLAINRGEGSSAKMNLSQQMHGLQLSPPRRVLRTRWSFSTQSSTETVAAPYKTNWSQQMHELQLSPPHGVSRTRWSSGCQPRRDVDALPESTNLSQQMQGLQLSPPHGVLRSRWSVGGQPCAVNASVLSTLQAVRKNYGTLMMRGSKTRQQLSSVVIPEEKNRPPVSEFWRLIASLNPLLMLHDAIPLRQIEQFLEQLSKNSPGNTPQGSPRRKKRFNNV